jgi:hypothetical protein
VPPARQWRLAVDARVGRGNSPALEKMTSHRRRGSKEAVTVAGVVGRVAGTSGRRPARSSDGP